MGAGASSTKAVANAEARLPIDGMDIKDPEAAHLEVIRMRQVLHYYRNQSLNGQPVDLTGDGKPNAIGYDTTGDGKIDSLDMNGQGYITSILNGNELRHIVYNVPVPLTSEKAGPDGEVTYLVPVSKPSVLLHPMPVVVVADEAVTGSSGASKVVLGAAAMATLAGTVVVNPDNLVAASSLAAAGGSELGALAGDLGEMATEAGEALGEMAGEAGEALGDFASEAQEGLQEISGEVSAAMPGVLKGVSQAVGSLGENVKGAMNMDGLSTAVDSVGDNLKEAFGVVKSLFD